jgi:hypothetical protein
MPPTSSSTAPGSLPFDGAWCTPSYAPTFLPPALCRLDGQIDRASTLYTLHRVLTVLNERISTECSCVAVLQFLVCPTRSPNLDIFGQLKHLVLMDTSHHFPLSVMHCQGLAKAIMSMTALEHFALHRVRLESHKVWMIFRMPCRRTRRCSLSTFQVDYIEQALRKLARAKMT